MRAHSVTNSPHTRFAFMVSLALFSFLLHQVPTVDDEAQIALVFRAPISAIYGGELLVAVDGTTVTVPVE